MEDLIFDEEDQGDVLLPPPPKKNFYTLWEKKNIVDEAYAAPCAFEKNCTQILYPNKPNP
jgi:hypothetical protein